MSNNRVWQDLTGTHEELPLGDWAMMEYVHGSYGPPGISQVIRPMNAPHMTGVEGIVEATWTLYRADNGELLGAHARHIVDGVQKPIFLIVHPDHQRQGIGTMMANYIISKYEEEHGTEFTYDESWGTMDPSFITTPTADFVNKYAKNAYEQ